tara:strand:- start:41792 stop:43768 length:1977 start_codon:yes stop_codon:yes gene_type:complete
MKYWLIIFPVFLFIFCSFSTVASERDSLYHNLRNAKNDEEKASALFDLGDSFFLNNNDSALHYFHQAYDLSIKEGLKKTEASTCIRLAATYQYIDPVKSAEYTMKSIKAAKRSGDESLIIHSKRLLALLYRSKGELDNSMSVYQEILTVNLQNKDSLEIARSFNDIGIIHMMKAEYDEGLDYWKKSLNIKISLGNLESAAVTMSNIGLYYKDIQKFDEAEYYIKRSLKLAKSINDFESVAFNLSNLAALYGKMEKYEMSESTFEKSLKVSDSIKTYFDRKETLLEYSKMLEKKGDFEKALEKYKEYTEVLEAEFDESSNETIQELKTKFETEKKEQELIMKDAELEKQAAEKALVERSYQYAIIFIFVVIIALGVILFILRKVRQAKKQVEIQRSLLEEKNKEILDSIQYAKRLQEAILPPLDEVKNAFAGFGILYLPKDIVAGDFYWFEETDTHRFIAAADCTGHGVPGAMVSVVCSNALTKSVQEDRISDPGSILNRTREIVIQQFEKSKSNVKDGMDVSLLAINKNTGEISWAGAHNPVWIIKQSNKELVEIKGNKQPIGNFDSAEPFKTHILNCEKGDRLYMFSDGFADQFGGNDQATRDQGGKKFKTKAFKRKLLENAHKAPEEQMSELQKTLNKWRGNLEQLDDVCVVLVQV